MVSISHRCCFKPKPFRVNIIIQKYFSSVSFVPLCVGDSTCIVWFPVKIPILNIIQYYVRQSEYIFFPFLPVPVLGYTYTTINLSIWSEQVMTYVFGKRVPVDMRRICHLELAARRKKMKRVRERNDLFHCATFTHHSNDFFAIAVFRPQCHTTLKDSTRMDFSCSVTFRCFFLISLTAKANLTKCLFILCFDFCFSSFNAKDILASTVRIV